MGYGSVTDANERLCWSTYNANGCQIQRVMNTLDMDEEVFSQKATKLLNKWWWPGQWLRIVWAVWVDQLWYWQNLRPWLQGKREASFFVQALFGGNIFGLILVAVIALIVETAGIHVAWEVWVAGFLIGMIVTVLWGGAATLFNGASFGVSACAIYGVLYPVIFSAFLGGLDSGASTLFLICGGISLFFALGIGNNLYNVIKKGIKLSSIEVRGHAFFYTIGVSLIARNLLIGITAGFAFVLGAYLSGHWATRQVSDTNTRKKLANAEKSFSDSLGF